MQSPLWHWGCCQKGSLAEDVLVLSQAWNLELVQNLVLKIIQNIFLF